MNNVRAHAPFDANVRVILHPDSVEITLTTGSSLADTLLRPSGKSLANITPGRPVPMVPSMADSWFTAVADGKKLSPRKTDVITDGIEAQLHAEYPLRPTQSLGVEVHFIPALPPPQNTPLVLTDENGNILASTILSPDKMGTEFTLSQSTTINATALLTKEPTATPETNSAVFNTSTPPPPETTPSFGDFFRLGVHHILNLQAVDHLLFLTALLLGCRKLKTMLLVVTGFTVAHSITLALAALNIITLSPRVVEPLIAASILFVAAENFRRKELPWQRYALTCGFGLIHGFGFATALRESGLTEHGVITPLIAFNVGVETGQLVVVAILLPLLLALDRWKWFNHNGSKLLSGLIIAVAGWWIWQRLFI